MKAQQPPEHPAILHHAPDDLLRGFLHQKALAGGQRHQRVRVDSMNLIKSAFTTKFWLFEFGQADHGVISFIGSASAPRRHQFLQQFDCWW